MLLLRTPRFEADLFHEPRRREANEKVTHLGKDPSRKPFSESMKIMAIATRRYWKEGSNFGSLAQLAPVVKPFALVLYLQLESARTLGQFGLDMSGHFKEKISAQ